MREAKLSPLTSLACLMAHRFRKFRIFRPRRSKYSIALLGLWLAMGSAPLTASTQTGARLDAATPSGAPADRLIFSTTAYCGTSQSQAKECRLGETLFVGFTNLREWMVVGSNHVSDIALVLNGRVMKGITSRGPDDTYSGLQFDLKRLDGDEPLANENRAAWNALIGELRDNPTLRVGVASGGNPPFWGSATVKFSIFPSYKWAVILFLIVLLILFLIVAHKSDIVRDSPSVPGQPRQSFSLARCQMAWWFFIIAASYNYIWLALGNQDSLTAGCLILTGISAGTGLAATVVDSSKRQQRQALEKERTLLDDRLPALANEIPAANDPAQAAALKVEQLQKIARLAEVQSGLANLPSPTGPSEGFLLDILRDETGVSFHRFQMAAWTIILGFVFVTSVYKNLVMPDFSAMLLGLMGISSGTYIGFKISDAPK